MVNFHENFVVATLKLYEFTFKIKLIYIYSGFQGDFSNFQKIVPKDYPHIVWFFFPTFTHL
jgi:hypothetical protein